LGLNQGTGAKHSSLYYHNIKNPITYNSTRSVADFKNFIGQTLGLNQGKE
jgi:hypothetical protein